MEARHLDSQLLPRCLRRGRSEDALSELRGLDGEAWRRLVDEALWHGVAPLLYHRLGRGEGPAIPPEPLGRLRDVYLHSLLRNQAILEQLSEILRETTNEGYPVLALKGAYLANCVYEEAALRPMGDIDLLVRPDNLEQIRRRLQILGYRHAAGTATIDYSRLHHLRPVGRPQSVDVEVHHDLAPAWAPFKHDLAGLWARSVRTRVDDLDLLHPAPDDVLLHLCAHAAFNDELRLGMAAVCDVDALVGKVGHQLDWARLVRTANSDGRSRFAYVLLRLSRALLGTPIPEDALAELQHDPTDDEVADEAVGYVLNTREDMPTTVQSVGDATTPKTKLQALWRGLFPPPETMRRIYDLGPGNLLLPLCYAARPFDLLLRRGRQVLGMLLAPRGPGSAGEKERRRRVIRAWARAQDRG